MRSVKDILHSGTKVTSLFTVMGSALALSASLLVPCQIAQAATTSGTGVGESEQHTPEHKVGTPGYGDMVPANLRVPANSPAALAGAIADSAGMVPHVCAGKKLLHHSHVDAAYATKIGGNLAMTVVDGSYVVPDSSTVCVRLAPDARVSDGKEVSRYQIPTNPAYSFLGKAGDIVWNAPQEQIDNWRPVWAGVGAFDTEHELAQPTGIRLNEIRISIAADNGPGNVHVWRTEGGGAVKRGLDSTEPNKVLRIEQGFHGHWNWTFTKAGVYNVGLKAAYTPTQAPNTEVTSPEARITWLVGSDEEVGLPQGTTTGVNPIKIPTGTKAPATNAGNTAGKTPDTEPQKNNGSDVAKDADKLTPELAEKQMLDIVRNPRWLPTPQKPDALAMKGEFATVEQNGKQIQKTQLTISASDGSVFKNDPVFLVPDSRRENTDDGVRWVLGAKDPNGSLTLDTTAMEIDKLDQPVILSKAVFEGPKNGRYILGSVENGQFTQLFDTATDPVRTLFNKSGRLELAHIFTQPGFYHVKMDLEAYAKAGNKSYSGRDFYFAVGDVTIYQLQRMICERDTPGQCADIKLPQEPSSEKPDAGNSGTATGGENLEGENAQGGKAPKGAATQDLANLHIIRHGHIDQAAAFDGKDLRVFANDGSDPANVIARQSGTFAFAVPEKTKRTIPADAPGYEEYAKAYPEGVWVLPESQEDGVPWVGFSTEKVDYRLLSSDGVTVKLRNFSGPGRMFTGNFGLQDGFVKKLDSQDEKSFISYPYPTHDHEAMYFTKPGIYTADLVYVLHLSDGTQREAVLAVTFLVGDDAIHQAEVASKAASQDTGSSKSDKPGKSGKDQASSVDHNADSTVLASTGKKLSIDALVAKLNRISHSGRTPSDPVVGRKGSPSSSAAQAQTAKFAQTTQNHQKAGKAQQKSASAKAKSMFVQQKNNLLPVTSAFAGSVNDAGAANVAASANGAAGNRSTSGKSGASNGADGSSTARDASPSSQETVSPDASPESSFSASDDKATGDVQPADSVNANAPDSHDGGGQNSASYWPYLIVALCVLCAVGGFAGGIFANKLQRRQ